MPDALPEILAAISALNVHARANGFGKKAIYAYKTFIAAEFATEARPVEAKAKCHHCGGTGIYRDWDGYHRGQCYRCTNGITTLRFIESTIGDYRWHHPVSGGGGYNVLNAVWGITSVLYPEAGGGYPHGLARLSDSTERPIVYVPAEGWGPNMPGAERLPPDEACRLLNVVEDWIRYVPQRRPANRWTLGVARQEMFRYQASLGSSGEGCCCACGTADIYSNCGRMDGWLHYSRPMCRTCHGVTSPHRWPEQPAPTQLTPNVVAWLARPERVAMSKPDWEDRLDG